MYTISGFLFFFGYCAPEASVQLAQADEWEYLFCFVITFVRHSNSISVHSYSSKDVVQDVTSA